MMNKFISIIALASVLVMSCSTTTSFNVYDLSTGNELKDYTIQIEGRTLRYGETISLSNAVWKNYNAIVRQDGYMLKQVSLEKEVKAVPLIFGLLLTMVPLLWCYGPEPYQTFMLVKGN
jgi:1,4-dihydroxy-2-naphthoate octaprenyltransferase